MRGIKMAGSSKSTTTARGKRPPAPKPAPDSGELSVKELARGIVSKEIRPRAADVRRLAEAVLAGGDGKPKKAKKADGGKKKDKSKKKLAKIPGQAKK
jgi:hypothetical protein